MNHPDHIINEAMSPSFMALLRPGIEQKKRTCLRCRKSFRSLGKGHRICANCKRISAKVSSITPYQQASNL
jgi:tRNA(Ile2) C34 agmatinyltransferase TiaS